MGSEILTYLRLGLHHIADLRGADHILFIAALTISYPVAEWRRLLWLVTAFTVGHSVTLALATLDLVRVNAALVEAGIALTIVATSLMAFALAWRDGAATARAQPFRYTLAALFGLIHGLGFSSFLRSLLGGEESIVLPLFSFNVGLELGQLLIVAAVLLTGALAVRGLRLAQRTWVLAVSGGIALAGLVLLVERVR
ncbi:MAG TPA: HupE/UreJ family protein [Gemmatimonadales bacterium]|nr:HupE/UreJ family protein [Gemmatimonadales bacterium]